MKSGIKIIFIKHLCAILNVSVKEIDDIIQNIDKFYYEKIKNKYELIDEEKKLIKSRTLYPSKNKLKDLQSRILHRILEKIPMPSYVFGAAKGRNNIINAKKHQGNKFFFLTDLKNFYPSITNNMVFRMFIYFGFSPTISRYLTQLTTYKGNLPQGTSTSPYISNLVFYSRVGHKIDKLCVEKKLIFTSFIDDLTISSKTDFKGLEQKIIQLIKSEGFNIANKKTHYKVKFPIVTGVEVKNNGLIPSKKIKDKIELLNPLGESNSLKGLKTYVKNINKISKTRKKAQFKKS